MTMPIPAGTVRGWPSMYTSRWACTWCSRDSWVSGTRPAPLASPITLSGDGAGQARPAGWGEAAVVGEPAGDEERPLPHAPARAPTTRAAAIAARARHGRDGRVPGVPRGGTTAFQSAVPVGVAMARPW